VFVAEGLGGTINNGGVVVVEVEVEAASNTAIHFKNKVGTLESPVAIFSKGSFT
jgi:hypothetical protein